MSIGKKAKGALSEAFNNLTWKNGAGPALTGYAAVGLVGLAVTVPVVTGPVAIALVASTAWTAAAGGFTRYSHLLAKDHAAKKGPPAQPK